MARIDNANKLYSPRYMKATSTKVQKIEMKQEMSPNHHGEYISDESDDMIPNEKMNTQGGYSTQRSQKARSRIYSKEDTETNRPSMIKAKPPKGAP